MKPQLATLDGILWRFEPCLVCRGTGEVVFWHKGKHQQRGSQNQRRCPDCRATGYTRSQLTPFDR